MENKKTITVEDDNVKHSFRYQLDPMSLQKEGCTIPATQFCYDCLYDLQITITSDCNNGKLKNGVAFDTLIRNFSLANFDTTCVNNPQAFNVNFEMFLSKGTYEITKKLTVSQQAMNYYRTVFLKRNQCITLDSFANEVRKAQALGNNCAPECATCLSGLGDWQAFWAQYRQKGGIADIDTLKYKDGALKEYEMAIRACDDLCEKATPATDYRKMMLGDLFAPNGQYADTAKLDDPRNIFYHNDIANGKPLRVKPFYQQVISYKDAAGNPALVYREATGRMVPPQELTIDEFIANFEESWADSLLKFHPEYCALNYYEVMKPVSEWDRRFLATETYGVAKQKGYMNPTGSTATPFSYFSASGTADTDPVSTFLGVAFKSSLESALLNYETLNSQSYSMQGFSAYTALCQTGSSPLCASNTADGSYLANSTAICNADKDIAWKNFRSFYYQLKKEKILAFLKTVCGATVASQLGAEGHIPRFANEEFYSLFPVIGTPPNNTNEANQQKDAKAAEAKAYFNSNCEAYVDYWINSLLSSCTLYNESDLKTNVVPKLLEVCKQGADMDTSSGLVRYPLPVLINTGASRM
ncbi:MAG: hypothetical protein J7578_18400 [Chitinophagaceae bacterium]|nr:hypothetical protein [Chitinophagaceae bacterium]